MALHLLDRRAMRHTCLLLLFVLPCFGMTCDPGSNDPQPDACTSPGTASLTELHLGPERIVGHELETWASADTGYISLGLQGGYMLGVTVMAGGASVPECIEQTTHLRTAAGQVDVDAPLTTYPESDGTRATQTLWLVLDAEPPLGSEMELTTEAGGLTASTTLTVVEDRHRLASLSPGFDTVQVGNEVPFTLESVHAPAFAALIPTITSTDTSVLLPPPSDSYLYEDRETLFGTAVGPGVAELVVSYGEQMVRAEVTVTP